MRVKFCGDLIRLLKDKILTVKFILKFFKRGAQENFPRFVYISKIQNIKYCKNCNKNHFQYQDTAKINLKRHQRRRRTQETRRKNLTLSLVALSSKSLNFHSAQTRLPYHWHKHLSLFVHNQFKKLFSAKKNKGR